MRCLLPLITITPAVIGSVDTGPVSPSTMFPQDFSLDAQVRWSPQIKFPTEMFVTNTTETVPGLLILHVGRSHEVVSLVQRRGEVQVERVSIGPAIINTSGKIIPSGSVFERTIYLSAGPQSIFARQVGGFLINPVNSTSGQLVINPSNASQYADGGEIFYGRNLDSTTWSVPVSVGFVGQNMTSDAPVPCRITSYAGVEVVPRATLRFLLERMQELGMNVRMSHRETMIEIQSYLSPSEIDSLPILEFLLHDENGALVKIGRIHPRDYVLNPSTVHGLVNLITDAEGSCSISPPVFRGYVLHFDTTNNRVGFANPLNAI